MSECVATQNWNNLKNIDYWICKYYESFGINDYSIDNKGRFLQYIVEEELDDEDIPIEHELGDAAKPLDCIYLDFDLTRFPISNSINYNQTEKREVIFYILQYVYKFNTLPSDKYINEKLFNLKWNSNGNKINSIHGIIVALSMMQTDNREKGLKLINKIANNIILHPNEPKYKYINMLKLSEKLVNIDIWFALLSIAGFSKSSDRNTLIFDEKKIDQLKKINTLLTMQKWNEYGYSKGIKCICDNILSKKVGSNLYDGAGVGCDLCGIDDEHSKYFWHCNNTTAHPNGYDVCDECQNKCAFNVQDCICVKDFVRLMSDYEQIMDINNLIHLVDCYVHIIHKHDNDLHFAHIVSQLGQCPKLYECNMLKRNLRDRSMMKNTDNDFVEKDLNDIVRLELLDKMHCYFLHCYDLGNRLTIEEREQLYSTVDEYNYDGLVNNKLIQIHNIVKRKKQKFQLRTNYTRSNVKFNQLCNLELDEIKNEDKIYSVGFVFKYGFDQEFFTIEEANSGAPASYVEEWYQTDVVDIYPTYSTLKEEMVSNSVVQLTIEQFNAEYKKASINFESKYCKQKYRPYEYFLNDVNKHITIEIILSLMIYCNYDLLQYEFSKTYRTNKGKNHAEFYWLGMYLKMCSHFFGQMMRDDSGSTLYHGMNEKMLFPRFVLGDGGVGIEIYGPLSTSSSFEVALNFTNESDGMVIQFGDQTYAKYFSCSWLSDFGNEKEFLFIQDSGIFSMVDIIDAKIGVEYSIILYALDVISAIFNHTKSKLTDDIPDTIQYLIQSIIHNEISYKQPSKYCLSEYAKTICHQFFHNKQRIAIHCSQNKEKYSFMLDEFYDCNLKWIRVDLLCILFPNMTAIEISDVKLCSAILDDIKLLVQKHQIKFPGMTITVSSNNSLTVKDVVSKLSDISVYATADLYKNILYIQGMNYEAYVKNIITSLGGNYYEDIDANSIKCINALIRMKISNEVKQNNFPNVSFDKVKVDWRSVSSNSNLRIFKCFYVTDHQWINLDNLTQLCPNVKSFCIKHIQLSTFVMEDILKHLITKKDETQLKEIKIELGNGGKHFLKREERVEICKKLTGYTEPDVLENDWKDFEVLYEMRQKYLENDDKLFHMDVLIASYAIVKYKERFEGIGYVVENHIPKFEDMLCIKKQFKWSPQ
eukprot:494917_1